MRRTFVLGACVATLTTGCGREPGVSIKLLGSKTVEAGDHVRVAYSSGRHGQWGPGRGPGLVLERRTPRGWVPTHTLVPRFGGPEVIYAWDRTQSCGPFVGVAFDGVEVLPTPLDAPPGDYRLRAEYSLHTQPRVVFLPFTLVKRESSAVADGPPPPYLPCTHPDLR